MDADALIARLTFLGARVVAGERGPEINFPDGTPTQGLRDELGPALREHRAAVLARLAAREREPEGRECPECGACVYGDDHAEIVSRVGCLITCPFHQPGDGPAWLARARKYALSERRQKAEQEERQSEPIPD